MKSEFEQMISNLEPLMLLDFAHEINTLYDENSDFCSEIDLCFKLFKKIENGNLIVDMFWASFLSHDKNHSLLKSSIYYYILKKRTKNKTFNNFQEFIDLFDNNDNNNDDDDNDDNTDLPRTT